MGGGGTARTNPTERGDLGRLLEGGRDSKGEVAMVLEKRLRGGQGQRTERLQAQGKGLALIPGH